MDKFEEPIKTGDFSETVQDSVVWEVDDATKNDLAYILNHFYYIKLYEFASSK